MFHRKALCNHQHKKKIASHHLILYQIADHQRQGSINDEYSGRNGHMPPKQYNERPGNNKWYNEKRNTRRSEEPPRPKHDYNYREQSRNRDRGGPDNINGKQRTENVRDREVVSVDRESNSSVENSNSRRRPKARGHNQSQSGK